MSFLPFLATADRIFRVYFVALPYGASIILSSTVSPAYVSQLDRRLQSMSLRSHYSKLLPKTASSSLILFN